MKLLQPTDLKKGTKVFQVGAWNHHRNFERSIKKNETKIKDDIYWFAPWTVHSIGKKLMRLVDEEGTAKRIVPINNGEWLNTYCCFVSTLEEVQDCALDIHNSDKFATKNFTVEYHRI